MKQLFYYLAAASCMLSLFASCDDEKPQANYDSDSRAIRINATINSAYSDGGSVLNTTSFAEGDCIALSCSDGGLTFELKEGVWTPTDKYYLVWYDEPTTYSAYYPVANNVDALNFSVPSNQQKAASLRNADYMTCTVTDARNNGSGILSLPMERRMAQVVLTLNGVDSDSKVQGLRIGTYQGYTSGTLNETTSLVSPYVTAPAGGKAGQNGTTYTAIVAPGEANSTATFVSLNYKGDDLAFPGLPALKAGMTYSFELNIAGSVITLSTIGVKPWINEVLASGEASEVTMDAYYVRATASGNATGMDWDNAMGADAFCSLIRTSTDASTSAANAARLDGKTIYLAGGTYVIAKDNTGVKLEYSKNAKQVDITILGGYDPTLTGTDISRRDPSKYVTSLVRQSNSNASATSSSMFVLGNQVNLMIDGVTFDGQYSLGDKGDTRCFYLAAGGSGDATLRLSECLVRNFNRCSDGGTDAGAAFKVAKGKLLLTDCEVSDNAATARGAAFFSNNAASYIVLNRCLLRENYASSAWGTAVHAGNGYFCLLNTTVAGTTASASTSVTVNGDAYFFVANSTLIGASGNTNGVFRAGKNASVVVNSLFARGAGSRTIYAGNITSKGYNVYQSADNAWGATSLDTDLSSESLPSALSGTAYQWTVPASISNFATTQTISSALDSFNATGASVIRALIDEADFAVDGRGVLRNPQKLQPGAYDAGL